MFILKTRMRKGGTYRCRRDQVEGEGKEEEKGMTFSQLVLYSFLIPD